jgi:P pilus assembly chaperone PapD
MKKFFLCCFIFLVFATPVNAEFIITSAIVEFTKDKPPQQDIEIVSRSGDSDYIVAETTEVTNAGLPTETRHLVDDPTQSRLLVTPDKTVLAGGSRKIIRFVLLQPPDAQEHIYRVAIKPVIKGLDNSTRIGLKLLIGYEVLVIIRPVEMHPSFSIQRHGKTLTMVNNGNTNIVLQNGQQCLSAENCKVPPTLRSYAGETNSVELPMDKSVHYSLWDGETSVEKTID